MLSPHVPAPLAVAALCSAAVAGAATTVTAPAEKRAFNLPRGDAAVTLKQFAATAGTPIVYLIDRVRGVTTQAVSGDLAPREALDRMLAGSGLEAAQDAATGALVVSRKRTVEATPRKGEVGPVSDPQPKAKPMKNSPRTLLAILAGWLTLGSSVDGQSVAPPQSTSPASEIVQLNVFQVVAENDDEYRAANTTAGTRYNTAIKDLPMNIEVLTPAFMRDIGALDVRDALEYISGIQLDFTSNGTGATKDNPENNTLFIRGISAGLKKDGFARFVPVDPITSSRVDIIKGPGGALYGTGATGGVVNISSVTAGDRPVYRVGVTTGSFKLRRIEALFSTPLDKQKRFGIALPMSYSSNESSTQYFQTNTFTMVPTLTVKIGPKTSFLASMESRYNFRDNIRSFFLTDNTLAPGGAPYGTLIADRPGTNRVLTTPNQRDFRFEGPDTFRKERDYVRTFRLDHRFTDNIQWWGGYSAEEINVRERSFVVALRNANDVSIPLSVRSDPRFLAMLRPSNGTAQPQILELRPNNITNSARTLRPTWKSEFYLAFDTGPVSHRLITGFFYGLITAGNNAANQNFYYGNTNTPADPITRAWENLPVEATLSRFRDPRDFTSVRRWDYVSFNQYPQGPASGPAALSSYATAYFWDRNLYANLQSNFFHNRFQTILGFFDTRQDRATKVYDSSGNYLWSGPAPAGSPAGSLNGVRRPEPIRRAAPSATAIWLPVDWFRLYANAMSALDPGPAYSAYDGNGKPLTAPEVKNAELGVRFDLLKNRLLLNVVAFSISDSDRPVNFGAAIQNLLVSPSGTANGSGFGAFVNTTTKSKGFDLKVDFIPVRNLRFNVGVSENNVQVKEIAPFATPANPDPLRLAAQQRFVAAGGSSSRYLGKPTTDISRYTGTAFVRYELDRGPLKNTWAMFGAKYLGTRDAELIAVNTANGDITVDRRVVPFHYLFDFNLGYRRKIDRYNTSYQLNVSNLANDDKFYGAIWQVGRTYRLSANLNF